MSAIGVFDSGVGGLTVAAAIQKRLPDWPIVYASDNAAYPYGTKPEAEVVALTVDRCVRLHASHPLALLVIACNTASTVSLPQVRSALPIPVVGVVPAIKPAVGFSKNRKVGLLATPATILRPYTDSLITEFASGVEVIKIGSRLLVDMAEEKLRGRTIDVQALKEELAPLFEAGVDTVVLGCTHFPLLLTELEQVSPYPIRWVDSGDAIASRCQVLLTGRRPRGMYDSRAVFTKQGSDADALQTCLTLRGFTISEIL